MNRQSATGLVCVVILVAACSSGQGAGTSTGEESTGTAAGSSSGGQEAVGTSTGTSGGTASTSASSSGSATGGRGTSSGSSSSSSGTTTGAFREAQHNPFPQIPYAGGFTIATPSIVTIYFNNDSWSQKEVGWAKWVEKSSWLPEVGADYGVSAGSYLGSVNMNAAAPESTTDSDVQALLTGLFSSSVLPAPPDDESTVYFIYYPLGSSVTGPGSLGSSCAGGFLGYHSWYNYASTTVIYAVIVDCGGGAVAWSHPDPNALEIVASHELMEAATDPFGGYYFANGAPASGYVLTDPLNPWTPVGNEVGDLCVWTSYEDQDAGYWAQRIYSNSAAAKSTGSPCAPVPPGEIFEGISGPVATAAVPQGVEADAFFTTWSSGPTGDWCVVVKQESGGFSLGNGSVIYVDGGSTVNNGSAVALPIAVPAAPADGVTAQLWMTTIDCATQAIQSIWPLNIETPPIGFDCTPPAQGAADPCAPYGLFCDSTSSTCQLPSEFGICQPLVGCAGGFSCEQLHGVDGGLEDSCLEPCATTADCADVETSCQANGTLKLCLPEVCGPGATNGTSLFGTCTSSQGNDGTCLPVQGATGIVGLCEQGGNATLGDACGGSRGGASPLCATGTVCLGSDAAGYACTPLCSVGGATAPGGGPYCSSGNDCVSIAAYGACLQDCASAQCPDGTTCYEDGSDDICLPY